jgi:hypothetical protein
MIANPDPNSRLGHILADMLTQAIARPGRAQKSTLKNGLTIAVRYEPAPVTQNGEPADLGGRIRLQMERVGVIPGAVEYLVIRRLWPRALPALPDEPGKKFDTRRGYLFASVAYTPPAPRPVVNQPNLFDSGESK